MSWSWRGDAILFDIDGTLVDSMGVIERHTRLWAVRNGLPEDEVLDSWHGRRDSDIIAEWVSRDAVEGELAWMRERSLTDVEGIAATPGSLELVRELPPGRWGLVTSGERDVVERRLAAAGFPVPAVLVAAEDVDQGKPDPEGFLLAADMLGVAPSGCLVFEDADSGVRAAVKAGMEAVMVGMAEPAGYGVTRIPSFLGVRPVRTEMDTGPVAVPGAHIGNVSRYRSPLHLSFAE
ncbi:HAD-IA family hydrolase [Streptomyces sp. MST-110588]|uniref:HAD-IA family hydrolase n=1 Tax=Streptomyces sp. MST-110588 TaxID=2833628 RepID=UPI001F5C9350|nr:HAD-IA family hydrolase [Streptomyces sp. MST-110588]UNO39175.1 HAD-IA family hydrolase [Streptomyces sp. MST-110588]